MVRHFVIPGKKLRRHKYVLLLIPLSVFLIFIVTLFRHVNDIAVTRFSSPPWKHPIPQSDPLHPSSALITQIPIELPDGLGHRFAVINFELFLAQALSVRYIHRVARYDSLTKRDRSAVEQLFGWDAIADTRERILEDCEVEWKMTNNCIYRAEYPVCTSLKPGSRYARLVTIPNDLVDCIPSQGIDCWGKLEKWAAEYPDKTLFQMWGTRCHEDYRIANFAHTRTWFRNWYWGGVNVHGSRVSLNKKRFQIVAHIRRGDFLNDSSRVVIPDAVFTDIACDVKKTVDEILKSDVGTDVHIFSEGVPKEGFLSRHDIDLMEKKYVTERGIAVDAKPHWQGLISKRCTGDVMVFPHIASDTIVAIHDMIGGDVFVGSKSGLSVHIVDIMSRGVRLVPVRRGVRTDDDWGIRYLLRDDGTADIDWVEVRTRLTEMSQTGRLDGIQVR